MNVMRYILMFAVLHALIYMLTLMLLIVFNKGVEKQKRNRK
jgi:hypothetical protein